MLLLRLKGLLPYVSTAVRLGILVEITLNCMIRSVSVVVKKVVLNAFATDNERSESRKNRYRFAR